MKNLDKEKTLKEAERIKKALISSTNPDLGLQDSDIEIKFVKEDDIYEITILKGRTVDYVEGKGAHVKNVSKVIDKDFEEYRRKGWVFTQPQGGSFRIGVPTEKVNEGFTFAAFLLNESQITNEKEALAELDEDEKKLFDEAAKEAKKHGLEVKFSGKNNGTGSVWGLYSAKHKEFVSKNYSVEALHARVVDEGLDDYDAEKNEFTQ